MKKLLAVLSLGLFLGGVAVAAPAEKVFVCKYVGKPGVDERLQTGSNPISVSSNAIKDYQGVGSYFNDAQGRSYVLEVDNGQPEPDVSRCPQTTPVKPNTDTLSDTKTVPSAQTIINSVVPQQTYEPMVGK